MKEFNSLVKNIKNKEFLPIYFLHGDESYYIDLLVKELENNILTEDEKAFDEHIIYGKDSNYQDIIALAKQFPVLAEKNVIIVKEAQDLSLKDKETELLTSYAQNPIQSTILVFAHKNSKLDGKKRKLNTALKDYLFLSEKVRDYQLANIISEECKKLNIHLAPNVNHLLAEYLGNDLNKIFNEIQKIKISIKENEIIDQKIIEKYIGISKEYNVFELQNALIEKDPEKSFKIAYFMGKNDKKINMISIISILFKFFSELIIFHSLKDKSPKNVAEKLKINPFFVKNYQSAAMLYPLKNNVRIISILRDFDLKAKGLGANATPENELLTELVYDILNIDKIKVKI